MRRALVAAAVLACAVPLWAQQVPDHPIAKDAVVQFLALTSDQVAQWDVLFSTYQQAAQPLWTQLRAVDSQIHTLLQGTNPDPTAVGALMIQSKGLRDQIGAVHQTYLTGFEALLGPDQLAKLQFMRRAAEAKPLVRAFRAFRLVPFRPDHDTPPPAL
jgi:Spy/CpxP family protein refolding chaperone